MLLTNIDRMTMSIVESVYYIVVVIDAGVASQYLQLLVYASFVIILDIFFSASQTNFHLNIISLH